MIFEIGKWKTSDLLKGDTMKYLCNRLPDDLGSSYADVFCIDLVPIRSKNIKIEMQMKLYLVGS